LDSVQVPAVYEGEKGEQLQAIPTGRRESNPFVPTGVELAVTIHSSVPGEIKAVTAQEVEAKQHEEEAKKLEGTLKKQEEALKGAEEHAKRVAEENAQLVAVAKKHQEEEAAAKKKREEAENATPKHPPLGAVRARLLSECKKLPNKRQRARCVARVHKKYGPRLGKGSRH
jgi:DNA repair exonuclease SbcCD ATPase subunit